MYGSCLPRFLSRKDFWSITIEPDLGQIVCLEWKRGIAYTFCNVEELKKTVFVEVNAFQLSAYD